jgi:hypothetical protein
METSETLQPATPALRPTFLIVLCILTFIGSGWGLYGGISSYFMADTTSALTNQVLDNAKDQIDNQPNSSFASKLLGSVSSALSPENLRKSSAIKAISCLFTLFGAIMMWQLRKIGFYSYIAGIAIAVLAPPLLIGGVVGWIASGGTAFIGLIFIILYGVNLKYLTK